MPQSKSETPLKAEAAGVTAHVVDPRCACWGRAKEGRYAHAARQGPVATLLPKPNSFTARSAVVSREGFSDVTWKREATFPFFAGPSPSSPCPGATRFIPLRLPPVPVLPGTFFREREQGLISGTGTSHFSVPRSLCSLREHGESLFPLLAHVPYQGPMFPTKKLRKRVPRS